MPRKSRSRMAIITLERRENPSLSPTGPYLLDELQAVADARVDLLTLYAQTPVASSPEFTLTGFLPVAIDVAGLRNHLTNAPAESPEVMRDGGVVLALPNPNGGLARFRIWSVEIMEPGLASVLPDVKTWRGQGIDDPAAVLAADVTDFGFHAQVLSPNGGWFIDPYNRIETDLYVAYGRDQIKNGHGEGCGCQLCLAAIRGDDLSDWVSDVDVSPTSPSAKNGFAIPPMVAKLSNGSTRRTMRTAVAATGEYTAFHGGTAALGQQAIVTAINRVSGVYETEVAVRLVLVANNISIVYTNASTDPYTNTNGSTMLGQNQTNVDAVIGSANYDLGHVFSTGGGGIAGLGVVGITGQKARGVTGSNSPVNDSFWIDYVAHEMGHQFGGNHTFNTSADTNRNASTAYEPGSGSTIQAYAGIIGSGEDLQSNSDVYFHAISLDEITNHLVDRIPTVGTPTATGNNIPVANAGADYTIPASTNFALTGSATDADAADVLTYNWEEYDLGPAVLLTTPDNGTSPLFRSFTATTSPVRNFPKTSAMLANTASLGEKLPTTSRTMNFRLTVRDNRVVGAYDFDDMVVTTVNTGAAFTVTSPNTAVSWGGGTSQTVTWNVAGTTGNGINAAQVNILLSTDGGLTFPTVLASATANDGSETIVIPNSASTTARIKVQPVNNIFFDISNVNFTITAGSAMQVNSTTPSVGGILTAPTTTLDLNFSNPVDAATVAIGDLTLSRGTVTGANVVTANTVRFDIAGLGSEGPLTVNLAANAISDTLGNGTGAFAGSYTVDLGTGPLPVAFTASGPIGTLAYAASTTGAVNTTADTDSFTFALDAGQTLSALVTPNSTLQPTVTITGPGSTNVTANATAAGSAALMAPIPIGTAGTYTVTLAGLGSTTGTYTLQLMLNSAFESESNGGPGNNSIATAQTLSGSTLTGGAVVRGVAGLFDAPIFGLPSEIEPNDSTATANSAANNFASATSNLYLLNVSGNASSANNGDLDWFNIGAMQVGDVLTISMAAAGGGRGTSTDTLVRLYNSAGTLIAEDDDGGPDASGSTYGDSLIYRYTIATATNCFIRASGYTAGTYEVAVQLENSGTAPTTGGTVTSETESNNTQATANNISTSWRSVNFLSTTAGNISSTTDSDFVSYPLTAGDLVTMTVTSTSSLDAKLKVLNSSGAVVAVEDGSSVGLSGHSAIYSYRVPTSGTYFAQVQSNTGTGSYSLTAHRSTESTVPPPSVAPDLFAVAMAAGETMRVGLDTGSGTPALDILNASGTVLATGSSAGVYESQLTYTATAAGTYYTRVSNSTVVAYSLIAVTGAVLDLEANDSFAAPQAIGRGSDDVLGALTGTDDWFSIDVSQNDQVSLTVDVPGSGPGEFANTLAPRHEVYTPANVLLASSEGGTINFTAAASGLYRVRVMPSTAVSPPTVGEYVLRRTTTDPAPSVAGTVIDDGGVQRSRIASLRVNFSEPVAVASGATMGEAFTLTGPGGAVALSATLDGTGLFATITFQDGTTGGSLNDGNYTLAIVANKLVDAGGQLLGGSTNSFHRFYGDANGDRTVNGGDFFFFRPAFGAAAGDANYRRFFDYLDDGLINGADLTEFRIRFGSTLP